MGMEENIPHKHQWNISQILFHQLYNSADSYKQDLTEVLCLLFSIQQIITNRTSQKFCACYLCPGGLFSDSCFCLLFQPPEATPAAAAVVPRGTALLPQTHTETLPFPPPQSCPLCCWPWEGQPVGLQWGWVGVPAPLTSPRSLERTEPSPQGKPKSQLLAVPQPPAAPGVPAQLLDKPWALTGAPALIQILWIYPGSLLSRWQIASV